MYNFILQIFIMLSLGTIVFLVARTLPRITETDTLNTANVDKAKNNWWSSIPFEKMDAVINAFLEKLLRRIKLILMKMDNTVSRQLNKFKKNGDNGNTGNRLTK